MLMQAAQAAADHIEGLSQRSVAPTAAALAALEEMGSEIPLRGRDPKELLAELARVGGPAMHGSTGGRCVPHCAVSVPHVVHVQLDRCHLPARGADSADATSDTQCQRTCQRAGTAFQKS